LKVGGQWINNLFRECFHENSFSFLAKNGPSPVRLLFKIFMVAILAMEQLAKDKRVSIDHEGRNSEGMMMLLLS
jgi:hypothetical protein